MALQGFVSDRALSPRVTSLLYVAMAASLVLAVAFALPWRGFMRDLMTLQAGGACIVEGCSPYDVGELDLVLVERGAAHQTDWMAQLPIYPIPSLALLAPFHTMSVRAFGALFVAVFAAACVLAGWFGLVQSEVVKEVPPWMRAVLFALMVGMPKVTLELVFGNPIVLVLPLLVFVCFDADPRRRSLRVVAFVLAVLLKPHVALPFTIPLLMKRSDGWRSVVAAYSALGAYTAAVLAWCAAHPALATWRTDMARELALGTSAGHTMDPSQRASVVDYLLNLRYAFGYWVSNARTLSVVTDVLLATVGGVFLVGCWYVTSRSRERDDRAFVLLVTGCTATITLLPVYHRAYDAVLLLLALPWASVVFRKRRHLAAASLVVLVFVLELRQWLRHASGLIARLALPHPRSLTDFLLFRMDSVAVFLLALALTLTIWRSRAAADGVPAGG